MINIQEMLKKYIEEDDLNLYTKIGNTSEYDECTYSITQAIKEIVERVIDKCADEVVSPVDRFDVTSVKNLINYE